MKNSLFFLLVLIFFITTLLTSCREDRQATLPEMFDRGIKYNISEEQLLKQEQELTFKTTDFGYQRVLTSNEQILINNDYAYVSYTFINDKLKVIEYKIEVAYSKIQIEEIPAYQVYDNYKQLLTNIYGAPETSNSDKNDYFETYTLQWSKNVITPCISAMQHIYTADYAAYPSEIVDEIEISFVYRENLDE